MPPKDADPNVATPADRAVATDRRPPGLAVPLAARIIYWGSMIGLALDATLAVSVINEAFRNNNTVLSILIVSVIGLIAAKLTTSAALSWNSGKRFASVLALAAAAAVGLMLAWGRTVYGVSSESGGLTFEVASKSAVVAKDELPATALMLALYFASMIGVFQGALKLFHPARTQLKHQEKIMGRTLKALAPMEADLVAIHERLARTEQRAAEERYAHGKALEQLRARESQLKAYARDAIALAVGDPSATPLIRAPHEPTSPAAG